MGVGEAFDASGRRLAEVAPLRRRRRTTFTAAFLAWAARRAATTGVEGVGAIGPVEAFGLDALRAGCEAAGLERVRP